MKLPLIVILLTLLPASHTFNFNFNFMDAANAVKQFTTKTVNIVTQTVKKGIDALEKAKDDVKDTYQKFSKFLEELKTKIKSLLNSIVNAVIKTINPKQLVEKLQKSLDNQFISSVKNAINYQQVYYVLRNSIDFNKLFDFIVNKFKSIFNSQQTWNKIKQKLLQFWNMIKKPLIALLDKRKQKCNQWCTSEYNFICFVVLDCEQKMNKLKPKLILIGILIAVCLACCIISFIYDTIRNFIKCILLFIIPCKLIYRICKNKKQNGDISRNYLKQAQMQIQPDIFTVDRFSKE